MRILRNGFKHNSLFYKMFLLTIVIIVTVSSLISWTTFRMSEKFFVERFSFNNSKVMDQIKESLGTFHYSIVIASNKLLQNGTVKSFLTGNHSNRMLGSYYYQVNSQLETIESSVEAYNVSILVHGLNGVSYATDRPAWALSDERLQDHFITTATLKQPKNCFIILNNKRMINSLLHQRHLWNVRQTIFMVPCTLRF